jgi:hypothetical protein
LWQSGKTILFGEWSVVSLFLKFLNPVWINRTKDKAQQEGRALSFPIPLQKPNAYTGTSSVFSSGTTTSAG